MSTFTFKKIGAVIILIAVMGMMGGVMGAVPMQTTQDAAENGRLIINGHKMFISGMNIAWNSFANDVGDYPVNITPFVNQFKQIKTAGGNAVRWWLHTDNQRCPKLDENGAVTGLGAETINNIRTVLDSAYNYGIVVSLCLFSFDLLQGGNKTADQLTRNKKFLETPANLDTYIENGLKPMLEAVGNHPAIMCWEVFNEPEGMTSDAGGWSTEKTKMEHVLRFTARIAAVVHDKTLKMASTGIHEYGKMKTWYSDDKLKAAAGNDPLASKAYLDFYMAHYYPEYLGTSGSPFHNPASSWGMDRPVLIGEFPAQSWDGQNGYGYIQSGTAMTITAAYEYAYDNGYCGALSWSMTEGAPQKFGSFETTEPALENLYSKHKDDIDGIPVGSSTAIKSAAKPTAARALLATVNGKTLKIIGIDNAETSVKLVNLKGKTVANFRSVGNASFGLNDIPAGNYLVELTANGKKLGSSRVVVR